MWVSQIWWISIKSKAGLTWITAYLNYCLQSWSTTPGLSLLLTLSLPNCSPLWQTSRCAPIRVSKTDLPSGLTPALWPELPQDQAPDTCRTPLVPRQAKQSQGFTLHNMGRPALSTPQGICLRISTTNWKPEPFGCPASSETQTWADFSVKLILVSSVGVKSERRDVKIAVSVISVCLSFLAACETVKTKIFK